MGLDPHQWVLVDDPQQVVSDIAPGLAGLGEGVIPAGAEGREIALSSRDLFIETDTAQQGTLAGAALPHDPQDLPLLQVKADVVAGHDGVTLWTDVGPGIRTC